MAGKIVTKIIQYCQYILEIERDSKDQRTLTLPIWDAVESPLIMMQLTGVCQSPKQAP